jgi:hypothetical protein
MRCPICSKPLHGPERMSPHGMWWTYCGDWCQSHFLLEERFLIVLIAKWLVSLHTAKEDNACG